MEQINMDLTIYREIAQQPELTGITQDRLQELVIASAKSLRHFFDMGVYGDPQRCTPDTLPTYWPYVRYLVADTLRPKFNPGGTQFTNWVYNDKFLTDLVDEALVISKIVPEDINNNEWVFFAEVSIRMLMDERYFIERGLISERGRQKLIDQSLEAGPALFSGRDMYEEQFKVLKKQYGIGPREQS